jgi:hypothetical protein
MDSDWIGLDWIGLDWIGIDWNEQGEGGRMASIFILKLFFVVVMTDVQMAIFVRFLLEKMLTKFQLILTKMRS